MQRQCERQNRWTVTMSNHLLPLTFCQSTLVGPPTPIFLSFQFIVSCRSNTSLVRASNLVCIRWLSWSDDEQCQGDTVQDKNRMGIIEWNKDKRSENTQENMQIQK